MAEKNIIVGVGSYKRFEVRFVVAVQHRNPPVSQRKMRYPSHEIDSGLFGEAAQILLKVTVSKHRINRNIQCLEKYGHFGENHVRADVAAMNNRINCAEDEFTGSSQRQINLTMRIGYDADFQQRPFSFSSWH